MFEEFFHKYPYTNFHEMNLDWVLSAIKEMMTTIETFVSANAIKYADPIAWDITKQYEKNTVVIDSTSGTAYLSVSEVPSGISLSRTEYWTVIFDLSAFISKAAKNFANTFEDFNVTIATQSTAQYGWLVLGDTLYRANAAITPGDAYTPGGNITKFSVEDVVGKIQTLNTTDKTNLVNAVNEILDQLETVTGDLSQLTTSDKDNLVEAINEVNNLATLIPGIISDIGDLGELDTSDNDDLVSAINDVLASLNLVVTTLSGQIGNLASLTTTDKTSAVAAINELVTTIAALPDKVGNLASLTTTDKTNAVAAINELVAAIAALPDKVGNLASLTTTDKTNAVAAINELKSNEGDITLLITSDKSSLVGAINEIAGGSTGLTVPRRNWLDNGFFRINQRMVTSGSTWGVIVDRWKFNYSTASLSNWNYSNGILTIEATGTTGNSALFQVIENYTDILGKTMTLSIMMDDNSIISGTDVFDGTVKRVIDEPMFYALFNSDSINIFIKAGFTLGFKAVKLEIGSESTLQFDTPNNITDELLRCQRYYHVYDTPGARPSRQHDCVPTMRANPTQGSFSFEGNTYYYNAADI